MIAFNATRRRRIALLALLVHIAAAPLAGAVLGEEEKKSEAAPDDRPAIDLSATERQAAERLRLAWWLGQGVGAQIWQGFDPNAIPAMIVERRPGREPFALLINHPSPPAAFQPALPAGEGRPAVLRAARISLPPLGTAPPLFAGARTATYVIGETVPDQPSGEATGERVAGRILHEMVHVFQIAMGLPADLLPAEAHPSTDQAEVLALAAVEGRILTEFIYTDRRQSDFLADLAAQFAAVRRARWALMGAAADQERRVEIVEGPAIFTELEIVRRARRRLLDDPPVEGADPSYTTFRFSLAPRVELVLGPLLAIPAIPEHLPDRAPEAGAAISTMLDRLEIDWRSKILRPDASFLEILEAGLALDAAGRSRALQKARESFGYQEFLDLARERLETSASR